MGGGGGALPFAVFSLFWEMIRKERVAARAECETAAAETRVERETAAAEQRRLMVEVYELRLQLAEEKKSRPDVVQSGTAGVQSAATAGGDCITNTGETAIGLNGRMHIEPMRWMRSESSPSPTRSRASTSSRNNNSGAVTVQMGNGETRVKQVKDVPLFGAKAKFLAWKQDFLCLAKLHGVFGIFIEGVDVPVADETMSIPALQEAFPHENVQKHSWPGTFSHGPSRIAQAVILYATLPHQLRDGMRQLTRTVRLLLVPKYSVSSR